MIASQKHILLSDLSPQFMNRHRQHKNFFYSLSLSLITDPTAAGASEVRQWLSMKQGGGLT